MSYVFKSGKFKSKSIAQLIFTCYPELVKFIDSARDKPKLSEAVRSFDSLSSKITKAKLVAQRCYYPDCSNSAPYMSLYYSSPSLYFWCEEHNPWEERVTKEPISIQASMRYSFKIDQRSFLRCLHEALGIKRLTKKAAEDFFYSI